MASLSPLEAGIREFRNRFGIVPRWEIRAPGRFNLIGEHTDYQEGFVLPAAAPQVLWILGAPGAGGESRVDSLELGASDRFDPAEAPRSGSWSDYVRGVACEFRTLTGEAPPFRALLAGDLPAGSGLSSSAALTVGTCLLLEAASGRPLEPEDRANLAHRAETRFVGVPCGIMDPYACALAREGSAMLLDCRSREVRHQEVPPALGRWAVVHSGVARGLRGSEYAERRSGCEEAARQARSRFPGARTLRDLDPDRLQEISNLLDPVAYRRARHVVTENARVHRTVRALAARDAAEVGRLLLESHRSLREDFEVSLSQLDALVEISTEEGSVGARLMGAGFGGCTLHLVPEPAVETWGARLVRRYRERCGLEARIFAVHPAPPAGLHDPGS